jgi:hypothetical protein
VRDLHVGRSVTWPAELASQAVGVLGMRGAGKSSLGRVYAEELFAAGIPFVVFDPVGAWVGIRSGRDGKAGGGLPVPLFGGAHGDLPLERHSGPQIADLVIDRQLSCVLDLSHEDFSEADKQVFLAAFGERLYRRKKRETGWLALLLEEADDYAPQPRSGGGGVKGPAAATLGVFQRLVRRGRARGLGALMITQRSAAINKDLLYMVGTLVAFRTTGPRDQEAIDGWLKYNQPALRDRVMSSLAQLEDGEAWVIAEEALGSIERVRFRRMNTYDTGATPEHGGQAKPATLADIDVPALSKELAAAAEKRKAEDPKELQREVAQLRAALAKAQQDKKAVSPIPAPRVVEKPVLKDAQIKRVEVALDRLDAMEQRAAKWLEVELAQIRHLGDQLAQRQQVVVAEAGLLKAALAAARDHHARSATVIAAGPQRQAATGHPAGNVVGVGRPGGSSRPAPAVPHAPRVNDEGAGQALGGGVTRRMLTALAQFGTLTHRRLAMLAGVKRGGSTWRGGMAALRAGGWITESGETATITDSGVAALGPFDPLPSGRALVDHWRGQLGGAALRAFDEIVKAWPHTLLPATLAERMDVELGGSTWRGALAALRGFELIPRNELRLSDEIAEGM